MTEMTNMKTKKHYLLYIFIFLLFFFVSVNSVYAVCSEPNASQYLVCEDWDSGTLPTTCSVVPCGLSGYCCPGGTWPCRSDHDSTPYDYWHDWQPQVYNDGQCGEITNAKAVSSARSYLIKKRAGVNDGSVDIEYLYPHTSKVYMRQYIYVPCSTANIQPMGHRMFVGAWSPGLPFFDDSDCRYARQSQGIWNCNNEGRTQPALTTYEAGSASYILAADTGITPYYWDQNCDKWSLIEFMIDYPNQKASIWINGQYYVKNAFWPSQTVTDLSSIKFCYSDLWHTNSYQERNIDNFVIDDNYIGPLQCQNNQQINSACYCGGSPNSESSTNVHTSGYCCDGVWQSETCSTDTTPPLPPSGVSVS